MKNKTLRRVLLPLPKISVSILNSDLTNLKEVVRKLEQAGITILHLDIMDGNFVPNLTFGPPVIKLLRNYTKCFFDVHLMVKNPDTTYLWYINAGADLVVFHYEAVNKKNIVGLIKNIKKHKVFCGISIKPKTKVKEILPYLELLDLVLVMTVEPGFGGQKILSECLYKLQELSKIRQQKNLDFIISCDGGVNENNVVEIINLGCDLPVVGNAIFADKNFVEKAKKFHLLTKRLRFSKYKNNYG
jgi:ribulose-phosphate 3-epimerase